MNKEFLESFGIESDVIKKIFAEYGKSVKKLKDDNEQFEADILKANGEIKTAQDALKNQTTIKPEDTEEYKTLKAKYDTDTAAIKADFDTYKTTKETETIKTAKIKALYKHLKADNVVEGSEKLLEKQFDLEKPELDGDNIKGWDKNEQAVAVKGEFAKFVLAISQNVP